MKPSDGQSESRVEQRGGREASDMSRHDRDKERQREERGGKYVRKERAL